jgi:inorganic pyrophosphatase/exopolyphosphatase
MTTKDESMSAAEIAHIARVLLGPEEDWDEADSEFVMKLLGVEPDLSTKEMFDLVLGIIKKFEKEREEVPASFINMLTQLASKLKREDPRVETTLVELKERLSQKASKGLAAAAGKRRFRGKRQLSKKDEKILRELEDELLTEKQDDK